MEWWVTPTGVEQSASKPTSDSVGPFATRAAANAYVASHKETPPLGGMGGVGTGAANTVNSWFTSMGGYIGSGIEAGFAALLSDVWNVIIGPLEIIAGAVLAIIVLMWIFKDDIAALARVM